MGKQFSALGAFPSDDKPGSWAASNSAGEFLLRENHKLIAWRGLRSRVDTRKDRRGNVPEQSKIQMVPGWLLLISDFD